MTQPGFTVTQLLTHINESLNRLGMDPFTDAVNAEDGVQMEAFDVLFTASEDLRELAELRDTWPQDAAMARPGTSVYGEQ